MPWSPACCCSRWRKMQCGMACPRLPRPVRIELKSCVRDSILELQGCGSGPGVSVDVAGGGLELSNTRARLQQLYGERQSLRLDGLAGGGTITTVVLPYHPEEAACNEAAR